MYIRSQDKTMIFKLDTLYYSADYGNNYLKVGDTIVGVYKSREEALLQIDQIASFLEKCTNNIYQIL